MKIVHPQQRFNFNFRLIGKFVLILLAAVFFFLFHFLATAYAAKDAEPKRVLVIYSYHEGLPWERLIDDSLRATLASKSSEPIELNVEHADRIRYPDDAYLQNFVDHIRHKYSHPKMDVVIGVDDEVTDILLKYGEELFPGVPVVFLSAKRKTLQRDSLKPNMTSLLWGPDLQGTVDLIYKLLPKTRQIFVISGSSFGDRAVQNLARNTLRRPTNQLEIKYLTDISRKDLLQKVTRLPENSVILYLAFSRDSEGKSFVPREILSDISRKANAPTFGIIDPYLGFGIVGGSLLSAEVQGRRCAEISLRILSGESPVDIVPERTLNILMFDERQLKRWGITEDQLPPGSIVRFKEHTFWERYKGRIIIAIAMILLQALIISFLLYQRRISRKIEQNYRTVADYTYDWEYWQNPDGSLKYVSPSCERICGYSVQDLKSNPALLQDMILAEDKAVWDEHKHSVQKDTIPAEIQFRIQRSDGEIRWIEHASQPIFDHQSKNLGIRASNRDITKRAFYRSETHKLRSELAHVDRIVTLSALTSALSHEINQPLAAMRSYAQAALRFMDKEYPEYDSVQKALQGIIADNKRAAEVVNRLRDLVKKEPARRENIDINSIIIDVISLINSELVLRNASITLDLNSDISVIQGDSIQIQQVLINLLTNALDEMDDQPIGKRKITVSTKPENLNEIIISISDSGGGIHPDTIEAIFSAFHTTKRTGIGLGLSISKSIIEAHGGKIWAENNLDGGATFSLILPAGSQSK